MKFDQEDAEEKWDSFRPTGTGFKADFAEAQRNGWKNPRAGGTPPQVAGRGVVGHGPLRLLTIADVMAQGNLSWLIKGILPRGGVAEVWGAPSVGKTFIILDACLTIARGLPTWQRRRVKQAGVVYVAAEGGVGLGKRLSAYQSHHELDLGALSTFRLIVAGVNIREEAERIITACEEMPGGVGLVVLDTLNRTMGGGDENSSKDMGQYLQGAALIAETTGALVLIIHHPGKNEDLGARGHSSLFGNIDCELALRKDGDVRVLKVTKQRDGRDGDEFAFRLLPVHLGYDEDGEPESSCVALEAKLSEADSYRVKPQGKWQERAHAVIKQGGCSSVDDVLEGIERDSLEAMHGRWKEAAKRAINDLLKGGLVARGEDGFRTL